MTGSITWNSKNRVLIRQILSAIDILNFYLDLRYDIRKNTNTKKDRNCFEQAVKWELMEKNPCTCLLYTSKSIIFVSWNNSGKIKNLSIMERQHIWKIIMNSKLYWIPSTIRTGLYIRRRHSMERILWSTTLAVTLIVSLSVTVELSAWQMKLLPTS